MTTPVRVLAVTDSDSYVKWGAALASRMPVAWNVSLIVLANPVLPSAVQLAAALQGSTLGHPAVIDLPALADLVSDTQPDLVLVSVRGALVKVIVRAVLAAATTEKRPVIVTGLPGISIPASRLAIAHRAQADLFVLHSRREVREFTALAELMDVPQRFGLATLPFLPRCEDAPGPGGDVIFAAQAKVPAGKDDRLALLGWLAAAAREFPERRVIIKVRAAVGEKQTHAEKYDYAVLVGELDPPAPANLIVAGGAMSEYLANAAALVTVSSTAAIEAIALGVPVLAIDEFGVSAELINPVFEGSGLLGGSGDLVQGRFKRPEGVWLHDNYFHGTGGEDWIGQAEDILALRKSGDFPAKLLKQGLAGGSVRYAWDRKRALGAADRSASGFAVLLVGTVPRLAMRTARQVRKKLRRLQPQVPLVVSRENDPGPEER